MKNRLKWLLVLTALMCMVCGWAMAETVHEMTPEDFKNRLDTSEMPQELKVTYEAETGWLSIVIDADKTDFPALYASLNGMSGKLSIQPPDQKYIAHGSFEGGYQWTDMQGMIGFSREGKSQGAFSTWVPVTGTTDTVRNIFFPKDLGQEGWTEVVLRWLDENNNEYFEHFVLKITYQQDNPEPVYLPAPNLVTAEMLAPMQDVVASSDAVAKCEIMDGQLHLFLAEFDGRQYIPLVLNAPDNAAGAEIVHDWYGTLAASEIQNGQVSLLLDHSKEGSNGLICCNGNRMGSEDYYMVEWKNASDMTVARNKLTISVMPYNAKPFFSYAQQSGDEKYAGLTPVRYDAQNPSASQLKITNNAKDCNIEWRYDQDTGTVYIFRDPDADASGSPGAITARVTPPDPSYKYARVASAGGTVILGNGKYPGWYEELPYCKLQTVTGEGIEVFSEEPLSRYKAGPMEVYVQNWYSPYGGGAFLIGWYTDADAQEPAAMQYIHNVVDKMYVESKGELKNKESDIIAPVKKITVVKPEKYQNAWDGWEVVIRRDPQYGLYSDHYEIYAVNDTGAFQRIDLDKGEEMILYMPYPEGMDMNSPEEFYLYHFNVQYVQKEKLLGEKTPYGIKYVIRSMSPFVLEWVSETGVAVQVEPFGAEDLTADLAAAGINSVQSVQTKLMAEVLAAGGVLDHTSLYDVKLYVLLSDGTKKEATRENFPMVNGKPALDVWMDLPEGTDENTVFTVVHMFAANEFGNKAGETENWTLQPVMDADGQYRLHFVVTGLSPIMISWADEENEPVVPSDPAAPSSPAVPQTGDNASLGLWIMLMMVSAVCMLMLRRRHA